MTASTAKTVKIFSSIGLIATAVAGASQWGALGTVGHAVVIGLGLISAIALGVAQVLGQQG